MVNPYIRSFLRGIRVVFLAVFIVFFLSIAWRTIELFRPKYVDLDRIYQLTAIKVPPNSHVVGSVLHGGLVPQVHAKIEIDGSDVPQFKKWLKEEAEYVGQDKVTLKDLRNEKKHAPKWWDLECPRKYITFHVPGSNGIEMGVLDLDHKKTAVLYIYALMR